MSEKIVPIRRALLSVSDKRGLTELARTPRLSGRRAAGQRRDAERHRRDSGSRSRRSPTTPDSPRSWAAGSRRSIPRSTRESSPAATSPTIWPRSRLRASRRSTGGRQPLPVRGHGRPGDATLEDAIENIDIGGPTLIRAAAKNHDHVAVLTGPDQYGGLIAAIRRRGGTRLEDRRDWPGGLPADGRVRPGGRRLPRPPFRRDTQATRLSRAP